MIIAEDARLDGGRDSVRHGFFGRHGGVSSGIYGSLNCGSGSQDDPAAVAENRSRAAAVLGVSTDRLLSLYQVHSAICLTVTEPFEEGVRPEADAMVTDVPGLALGVLTADCGPVLLTGTKANGSPVIGAAHAGWGGALGGILEATVLAMRELGAIPYSIRAALGPCIGPASYEVSTDFEAPFLEQDVENAHFFRAGRRDGHLMFDLPGYIARRLALAGVERVYITGVDTCADEERCFSYRRATLRGEPDYGRQLSAVVIM